MTKYKIFPIILVSTGFMVFLDIIFSVIVMTQLMEQGALINQVFFKKWQETYIVLYDFFANCNGHNLYLQQSECNKTLLNSFICRFSFLSLPYFQWGSVVGRGRSKAHSYLEWVHSKKHFSLYHRTLNMFLRIVLVLVAEAASVRWGWSCPFLAGSSGPTAEHDLVLKPRWWCL